MRSDPGGLALALNRYMKSGLGGVNEAIKENEIRVEFLGLSPRWILYANYLFAAGISAVAMSSSRPGNSPSSSAAPRAISR